MSTRTLGNKLDRLEAAARLRSNRGAEVLDEIRADPTYLMTAAGMTPDPWQAQLLQSDAQRIMLLASRQAGKSEVAAALSVREALLRPGSLILLLSPSERQSGELQSKVFACYDALEAPVPARKRTELQLHLTNGSRIIALPENERTIRGYSGARLLVVDEAARVDDGLYRSVRPMLAVSRGRLLALSTPFGKRGWFFEAWESPEDWQRVKITADQCPRITAEFLAEERRALGERYFLQEYHGIFSDCIDAVFSYADIQAALSNDVKPLFGR
jgi:hypothetical protein